MDSEESEYDAYMFYQLLEQRSAPQANVLSGDIKVTPDMANLMSRYRGKKGNFVPYLFLTFLALSRLWKDNGVRKAFKRGDEFDLSDCAGYFLSNIDRMSEQSYVPTTQV